MTGLSGRTAVVTGAAQGIGRATALRLARDGARLALVDRVNDACNRVCKEIISAGGSAEVVEADMETREGMEYMVEKTLSMTGRIDIMVNNVGGAIRTKPFHEFNDEEIQQEISRTLWPTLRGCRAIIPHMIEHRRGTIVNIGSVATRGIYRIPYSAAKGGVHALTRCLAMELAEYNIRVNCVAPGAIEANRVIPRNPDGPTDAEKQWRKDMLDQTLKDTSMQRMGTAAEVANAVAFLAGDDASYVTGQVLYVSGGG